MFPHIRFTSIFFPIVSSERFLKSEHEHTSEMAMAENRNDENVTFIILAALRTCSSCSYVIQTKIVLNHLGVKTLLLTYTYTYVRYIISPLFK